MDESKIKELVAKLDVRSVEDADDAWSKLKSLGGDVVPYLARQYTISKAWQARVPLIFYATRYARVSEAAFELGIAALKDRATLVRYRACGLCAYSLRKDALPHLKELLSHADASTRCDALAAIDAIRNQNHNYFIDRDHSGQIFWTVGSTN